MSTLLKRGYRGMIHAGASVFLILGATPNTVTLAALVVGLTAAAVFIATQNALLFGALMIFGAFLDALDGEVARRSGSVTKLGGYLDAMCDRLYESAVVFAAAYGTRHWAVCFLLMVGSYTVSYTKARAAVEVPISNEHGWPALMGREGRSIGFGAGILLLGLLPDARWLGQDLFFWILVLLTATIFVTALQRILRAREIILASGSATGAP